MLHVINHPLIKHKLTIMRKTTTGTKDFRENLDEITALLAFEACRDLKLVDIDIETPVSKTVGNQLEKDIVLVPILRAGLGMVDGIKSLVPNAKIGHIGLFRNEETLKPESYFKKFPVNIKESSVIVLDPMLATGGSAVEAIRQVKETGATDIKLICLVGVQQGADAVMKAHPDVEIYLASLDEKLNEKGYIVPGLGDAGDRLFGTK